MAGVLWACPEHGTTYDGDGRECCTKAWPVDLSDHEQAVQEILSCPLPDPTVDRTHAFSGWKIFTAMLAMWALLILVVVGYLYFTGTP